MLGFIFGFNARLGRLQFFLASLALGVITVILAVAVAFAVAAMAPQKSVLAISVPILAVIGISLLANLMLQAMRFRDIGWDPVCVIPAWIAVMALDYVIASRFPEYAATAEHSGTWVGALINLAMCIALLFFPSSAGDTPSYGPAVSHVPPPASRSSRSAGSATEARLARITGGDSQRRGW